MNPNIYSFFGVDGAGKTTTIRELKKRLEKQGKRCTIYLMGRAGNHKLPFIRKLMKLKANYLKQKKGIPKTHDALLVDIYRKRGLGFMLVYYLDLWLRFREAKKLSQENIVLMDRFFYDGLALCKPRYISFFRRLTPQVKSFFLYAPPEVILKRKQEATAQNMVDYKKRVDKELMPFFNITSVDTSRPLAHVLEFIESRMNPPFSRVKAVFEECNRQDVRYAILRNHDNLEKYEDIDFLVHPHDGRKLKKILKRFGFIRRFGGWGPFLISDKRFDVKMGCIEHGGYCLWPAKEILKRRKKKDYFYILDENDELKHLILKALGGKFAKPQYMRRINELFPRCDIPSLKKDFLRVFGPLGRILVESVEGKNYSTARRLRRPIFKRTQSLKRKLLYLWYRGLFFCFKR